MKKFALKLIIFCQLISSIFAVIVKFNPLTAEKIIEDSQKTVSVEIYPTELDIESDEFYVKITSLDESIANPINIFKKNSSLWEFEVCAKLIGVTNFSWTIVGPDLDDIESGEYYVTVIQEPSYFGIIFTIVVTILVGFNNINMGCHLNFEVIKGVVKKPVAPVIGFLSQFLFMPLVVINFLSLNLILFLKGFLFCWTIFIR